MIEARNPYLLLGIPFGSARETALTAFARKSRSLRRAGAEGKSRMADLTWALNQVTESLHNPQVNMAIYRIPADPAAFATSGAGVLNPGVETMARRYSDVAAGESGLRRRASHEYLRYLILLNSAHISPAAP